MKTPNDPDSGIRLAILGLGNMGAAILGGALDAGVVAPTDVLLVDPASDRLDGFRDRGCRIGSIDDLAAAPCILLAVKPQIFPEIAPRLAARPGDRTVISVMAGLHSERIADALGAGTRVIRAMPNTPASIGHGVTAISTTSDVPPADRAFAKSLFESVGTVVDVEEDLMFAVTATSGSGPAWVFRLVEAWIEAAVEHGIPHETAKTLVHGTLLGAAHLLDRSDQDAGALRKAVTSKGGTTAAGQTAMDDHGFDHAVRQSIAAATRRGRELDRDA
ncbi:MAG: pyrroline-5-carboxylate reductase [Phycisphaerae bacterium]|nr:pyrroline-5-carboxylate reductase [Phycisphaerae bacterium]